MDYSHKNQYTILFHTHTLTQSHFTTKAKILKCIYGNPFHWGIIRKKERRDDRVKTWFDESALIEEDPPTEHLAIDASLEIEQNVI